MRAHCKPPGWPSGVAVCKRPLMNAWIKNVYRLVLGLFVVAAFGAFFYEYRYVWPVERCERRAAWWDARDRQCLTPMPIWRITGRLPTPSRAGPAPAAPRA